MTANASAVGFDFVDRRVMAAVQRVAASDPNPADPFRGLYISDETALQLTHGESASGADDRLAAVCQALEKGDAPAAGGRGPLAELSKRLIRQLMSDERAEVAA